MSDESIKTQDKDPSILIVDDNTHYSKLLLRLLQAGFGFSKIERVDSTSTAYDLIKSSPNQFDLLFVDYNFPDGANGGELLLKLKSDNLMSGKVAFLITSEPSSDNMAQASKAGAAGVVAKPFDKVELERQVKMALNILDQDNIEQF
jgi:CheY-like chemotaxis protein